VAGEEDGREAVRRYVRARMADVRPPITREALGRRAGISRDTVGDFLTGRTWPQPAKLDAIEQALGIEPGTLAGIEVGDTPDDQITQTAQSAADQSRMDQMVVTFTPDALRDLSPTEREEVEAAAKIAALRAIREIKGS
jgi:transcriptional regulator with XRE-family HTH domain